MLKSFSTFLSMALLSLALTTGAYAQPAAGSDDAVTTRSAAETDDDDDEAFDKGWLGLLGLLGLAGLIPRKHRDHDRDHVQRRDVGSTTTRT